LHSKAKTKNFERRSVSPGCLLLLIAVAPVLASYTFYDGEPKNLTLRNIHPDQRKYGEGKTQYSHVVSRSPDTIPPTTPANLTVITTPIPIVQAVQGYFNPTFLTAHTTDPFDSSGGDLIVVCASSHAGVTMTPSDIFNNTWISAAGPTNTNKGHNLETQVWYAKNPTVGPLHTVTLNLSVAHLSTAQSLVMSVIVVRGSNISAPIDAISPIGDDGDSRTLQITSPRISTTNTNDLLIGFAKSSSSEIFTQGSGFTAQPAASSDYLNAETGPAVTPGTYDAPFTLNSAVTWQAVVVAVSPSPFAFALSWTAATDNMRLTGYVVERCQGAGCRNFAPIATTTLTTFTDTRFAPTTSYRYRVRAIDAAGNLSHYSKVASANSPTNLLRRARGNSFSYRVHPG
jgi:hypothetical protein